MKHLYLYYNNCITIKPIFHIHYSLIDRWQDRSCDSIEMSKHMIHDKRRVLKARYISEQCNIRYRTYESCTK